MIRQSAERLLEDGDKPRDWVFLSPPLLKKKKTGHGRELQR